MSRMKYHQPLDSAALSSLYQQLSQLDRAGIAPLQALARVHEPSADGRIQETLRRLNGGKTLSQAGRGAGLFVGFDGALIEAGEQSGIYPFAQLAKLHEARGRRGRKVVAGLWLPGGVLLLGLLLRPLPQLVGGQIGAGEYVAQSLLAFALVLAGGYLLWRLPGLLRRFGLGDLWDAFALRLPIVGNIIRRRNMLEFARALGLLVQAGVPMFEAMPKAIAVVENRVLRRGLNPVEATLRGGSTVVDALRQGSAFDANLLALVDSGEFAGSVDRMLLHYAEREEEQVSAVEDELARWAPRLIYLMVALWMAWSILSAGPPGSFDAIQQMDRELRG